MCYIGRWALGFDKLTRERVSELFEALGPPRAGIYDSDRIIECKNTYHRCGFCMQYVKEFQK